MVSLNGFNLRKGPSTLDRMEHRAISKIRQGLLLLFALLFSFLPESALARSVSPFPSNLAYAKNYRGHNGVVYYFYVTGSTAGSVWGTAIYTDDSSVATAAVHAGVLANGQRGVVKVTILPGQESYVGSTANGVTSRNYFSDYGSFSVAADDGGDNPTMPDPTHLVDYRENPGAAYLFTVTGDADAGTIWGTNAYSDDSKLASAVVHAGILADGQTGVVKVVIGPPQSLADPWGNNYPGCTFNGVSSADYYKDWPGTYSVMHPTVEKALIPYPGTKDNPLPDPGSLTYYRGLDQGAFYFTITGTTTSLIWGTGVYTDDSTLRTAAVHSGVLSDGETGTVKVTVLPGQSSYAGSSANGVTSSSYGSFIGSYSVATPDGSVGQLPVITSATTARAMLGRPFSYQITAMNNVTAFNATGLPMGLTINKATGLISGTPELNGLFVINLLAQNSLGIRSSTLVLTSGGSSPFFLPFFLLLLD